MEFGFQFVLTLNQGFVMQLSDAIEESVMNKKKKQETFCENQYF